MSFDPRENIKEDRFLLLEAAGLIYKKVHDEFPFDILGMLDLAENLESRGCHSDARDIYKKMATMPAENFSGLEKDAINEAKEIISKE
ncbi:hypothetical protein YWS52_28420 [Chitiniphilus shinanonensis]